MAPDIAEGTPATVAPTDVEPKTTVAAPPTTAEVTEAASKETPAKVDSEANEREYQERVALLEKRERDTESALRDKQRELHETTGRLKAERDMAEQFRNEQFRISPEAAQKQREEFLERVRLDPGAAVEWAERNLQSQAAWMQEQVATLERKVQSQLEDLDPVVVKNKDMVERLKADPDFAGLPKRALANLAEKFKGISQPDPARPPPAPVGVRRVVESSKKDVLPDWWKAQIAMKNDASIEYKGDINKEGRK